MHDSDRWRSAAQFESRKFARTRPRRVYTPVSSSFAALACPALFGSTDDELAARHSLPPRSYFVILHMRLTRSTKDRVKGVRLLTRCAYYPGALINQILRYFVTVINILEIVFAIFSVMHVFCTRCNCVQAGETHITVTRSLPCYAGICVRGNIYPGETHITVTPGIRAMRAPRAVYYFVVLDLTLA